MLQMKEAVNEEHEGKRKAELTWKINRIHWEKNRFIYDLMYQRKVLSRELVSSTVHLDISCKECSLGSVYPNALACPCGVTQCARRPGSITGRTCLAVFTDSLTQHGIRRLLNCRGTLPP